MALTKNDLEQIKHIVEQTVEGVTTPQFEAIDRRFDTVDDHFEKVDMQLNVLATDVETLALTAKVQFDVVLGDLKEIKEDVVVIKDIVKDHSFRIARLEHRTA